MSAAHVGPLCAGNFIEIYLPYLILSQESQDSATESGIEMEIGTWIPVVNDGSEIASYDSHVSIIQSIVKDYLLHLLF